jgi:hypothetical protein
MSRLVKPDVKWDGAQVFGAWQGDRVDRVERMRLIEVIALVTIRETPLGTAYRGLVHTAVPEVTFGAEAG